MACLCDVSIHISDVRDYKPKLLHMSSIFKLVSFLDRAGIQLRSTSQMATTLLPSIS